MRGGTGCCASLGTSHRSSFRPSPQPRRASLPARALVSVDYRHGCVNLDRGACHSVRQTLWFGDHRLVSFRPRWVLAARSLTRAEISAPVHRLGPDHHIKFRGRTLRGGGRSRQDGCAFCSRLTRRVAFRGCIALAPISVTGIDLCRYPGRSTNAGDWPTAVIPLPVAVALSDGKRRTDPVQIKNAVAKCIRTREVAPAMREVVRLNSIFLGTLSPA